MIKIPPITGSICSVPLSSYEEIIDNYVSEVGKIEQVSSIVQIGSFTKPGISDIDLMVTLKDDMPFPGWADISLRELSKWHKDAEIISHDIFAIPESIARNAEAYFYIDQQNVLKGKTLGGNLSKELADKCKEFLALEYAIFSLDSVAGTLLSRSVNLRNIILFISTMRHSVKIALDLKIINESENNLLIAQIEKLRSDVIDSNDSLENLPYLFEMFINILSITITEISNKVTREIVGENLKKGWMVSSKTGMIGIENDSDYLHPFIDVINLQRESFLSKYLKVFTVPVRSQMHIGAYLDGNGKAAVYFRNNFKMVRAFHDQNELNTKARQIRGEVVRLHWEFINKTGYLQAAGKAYCGLSYFVKNTYKSFLRKNLLHYQLRRISSTIK
jgi:hypothetical protein